MGGAEVRVGGAEVRVGGAEARVGGAEGAALSIADVCADSSGEAEKSAARVRCSDDVPEAPPGMCWHAWQRAIDHRWPCSE